MPGRKSVFTLALLLCLFGISIQNWAADKVSVDDAEVLRVLQISQDIAYGEYLAGECASCHSLTVASGSNVPVIHGVESKILVKALLEYRNGIRENTTMMSVAGALGDEEIAVIALYLESKGS